VTSVVINFCLGFGPRPTWGCTNLCTKTSLRCPIKPTVADSRTSNRLILRGPAGDCHGRGREFESRRPRHSKSETYRECPISRPPLRPRRTTHSQNISGPAERPRSSRGSDGRFGPDSQRSNRSPENAWQEANDRVILAIRLLPRSLRCPNLFLTFFR